MSSEENVIAMPADNSIASDAISAKLIEVSRVAESLDTILHETQDGLNNFESMMATSTSAGVERKLSSTNNSDVSFFFSRNFNISESFLYFRTGIQV